MALARYLVSQSVNLAKLRKTPGARSLAPPGWECQLSRMRDASSPKSENWNLRSEDFSCQDYETSLRASPYRYR